jgi:hypothetical protein
MTIEIGSLVVRGTFGAARAAPDEAARLEAELDRLRQDLRLEMREMLRDLERRQREG